MMSSNAAALTSKGIRIAIVGVGNVGASYAFALLLNRLCSEIVLIDSNHAKAEGEAMDLNHAVPFAHPTRIWAGDFADCAGAAITVIAAGSGQKPGETRLDMVVRNGQIWRQIVPQVVKHNPGGILLIATNPVDVLTYAALKLSGLPANRVIGSRHDSRYGALSLFAQRALQSRCTQRSRLHHRRAWRQRSPRVVAGQYRRDEVGRVRTDRRRAYQHGRYAGYLRANARRCLPHH
jgi:hypothetical protein